MRKKRLNREKQTIEADRNSDTAKPIYILREKKGSSGGRDLKLCGQDG